MSLPEVTMSMSEAYIFHDCHLIRLQDSFKGLSVIHHSGLHPLLALLSITTGPQATFPKTYDKHNFHENQQQEVKKPPFYISEFKVNMIIVPLWSLQSIAPEQIPSFLEMKDHQRSTLDVPCLYPCVELGTVYFGEKQFFY